MIRRFRLELKAEFEKLVIAQLLTGMLDKYLTGRLAPLGIGAEQGDIDEWDDVVINHTPDTIEHMQVKRQTTNFCNKNPDLSKETASQKKASASAPTQSVLDKAFASLARWEEKGSLDANPNHTFKLILVGEQLEIKKELRVSLLAEICKVCSQDGFQLKDLVNRTDIPTKRLYLWLTTWCGFKDWDQISKVLKRVHIYCAGNEETLKDRVNETLTRHFINPQRTFDCLLSYITSNTSDVTMLSCHELARALQSELRPDIETWAQYALLDDSSLTGKSWSVVGIHDLSSNNPGSAKSVVDHMWSNHAGNRKLRVYAPYSQPVGDNLTLPVAITRMALHLKNGAQSLMLGELAWRSSVGHEVGHTLGSAENDLRDLPWIENSESLQCLTAHEFKTQSASRVEAEALSVAMDELLWLNLVQEVSNKLATIKDPNLANEMEKVWLAWGAGFNNNPESRRLFMERLLYPETENKKVKHALRLGPRTLHLLVTAVEILLLVTVGLVGHSPDWASYPTYGKVQSIALQYWSGPSGGAQEVREISNDSLLSIVGPSPDPIVILSGTITPPSALLNTGMADDAETATSMAAERQPRLLVTRSGTFQHLREGTLASAQNYFSKQWQDRELARNQAIEKNT